MSHIIIRNGANCSADTFLCMGEARQKMGREVIDNLCKVIDYNQRKKQYFLLASSRIDPMEPKIIRTKIVLSSVRPPEMFGTMCWHINNKKGRVKLLWMLPLDRPKIIVPEGAFVPEIARQARGLGLSILN